MIDTVEYWDERWRGVIPRRDGATIEQFSVDAVTEAARVIGPGKTVLDFGCGPGRWHDFLCGLGWDYTGFDTSSVAIAEAERAFPDSKWVTSTDGLGGFDCVFCCTVIIHCPEASQVVGDIRRLLKAGGSLLMIESTWDEEFIEKQRARQSESGVNQHMAYRTMGQTVGLFDGWGEVSVTQMHESLSFFHIQSTANLIASTKSLQL